MSGPTVTKYGYSIVLAETDSQFDPFVGEVVVVGAPLAPLWLRGCKPDTVAMIALRQPGCLLTAGTVDTLRMVAASLGANAIVTDAATATFLGGGEICWSFGGVPLLWRSSEGVYESNGYYHALLVRTAEETCWDSQAGKSYRAYLRYQRSLEALDRVRLAALSRVETVPVYLLENLAGDAASNLREFVRLHEFDEELRTAQPRYFELASFHHAQRVSRLSHELSRVRQRMLTDGDAALADSLVAALELARQALNNELRDEFQEFKKETR